jgi:hypothetical protein
MPAAAARASPAHAPEQKLCLILTFGAFVSLRNHCQFRPPDKARNAGPHSSTPLMASLPCPQPRIQTSEWRNQNPQKAIDEYSLYAPMSHLCRNRSAQDFGAAIRAPSARVREVFFEATILLDTSGLLLQAASTSRAVAGSLARAITIAPTSMLSSRNAGLFGFSGSCHDPRERVDDASDAPAEDCLQSVGRPTDLLPNGCNRAPETWVVPVPL